MRIELTLTEKVEAALARVQERTGAGTVVEVIRRALSVYDTLTESVDEGAKVIVRQPDGAETEIDMLKLGTR